ncbi:hypothetical protein DVH24_030619 [Malus domestica]|uniref:ADP-ribosyl cyclase/cyclic ADP-ribose hydrolase n=1 Tax=Malus domestica TaxID=3750 RepID=A0A498JW49_MALDO|nr:hypothetical protein DVH24_030619 [Malus domestica]
MALASAPAVFPWKYHVFLSFRGEDTRRGFTDHLYKQLEGRGIKTFRDEPELERGTEINPELMRAIDQSRSAIIVLSTNFASSSWCLRELTHIVRCMKEKKRIFPIFYGVDPSDVRHQRGSFGKAIAEHEVNYREHMEEVNEWRKSLKRVANLAGWNSKDYRSSKFWLTSVNCFSLAGNQGCNAIMHSMLKRFIQELPHFVEFFSILIPGSEIPEWFNNQSMGDSVIEKLPSHSCNREGMGFALCAIFAAAESISAPTCGRKWLRRHEYLIEFRCSFGSNSTFQDMPQTIGIMVNKVVSDHLWLVFLSWKFLFPSDHQPEKNRWESCWNQIQFHFETECAVGSKTCLKVKKCGVRPLYEQDTEEELNRTTKQYSDRSISLCEDVTNCDFEE